MISGEAVKKALIANGLQWLRAFDPLAGSVPFRLFFNMPSTSDHSLGYTRSVPRPSLIRSVQTPSVFSMADQHQTFLSSRLGGRVLMAEARPPFHWKCLE